MQGHKCGSRPELSAGVGRSLDSRAVGVARSLGELRPRVLAHVWGPPPVQFPGNRHAIPEESGGNGAGGGGHLGLSMRNEATAGSGVRGLTQSPGLYSDQVARWVEQGPRGKGRVPLGVFYAIAASVPVRYGLCGCGAPRDVELRTDPCRSPSLRLVLKTAEAWICGRRGLFCLF